jgi:hypothetical protein
MRAWLSSTIYTLRDQYPVLHNIVRKKSMRRTVDTVLSNI